jgi:hypothetical protein
MLGSSQLLCDAGFIDVYNKTGEAITVIVRSTSSIGAEPAYPAVITNGTMKFFRLGDNDARVTWTTAAGKKYKAGVLARPGSLELLPNGSFIVREWRGLWFTTAKGTATKEN